VNALGQRMRQGRKGGDWTTIVGVAADVHTQSLDRTPDPEFYTPVTGSGIPALMVAVRTPGDPLSVAAAAREAVWAIDRDVPVADLQPMRTMIGTTFARPRLLLTLLGSFAVAGLALGAIGVYGVVAFGVTRRRREIGIRVALGADRASIAALVLRESSAYAGAGLLAGLVLALASSRLMRGLLFEVPPVDPLTYGVLAAGVAALVALASYRPVRRAVAVDPAEALRSER
jgi:putative ABC transport system permease protein